MESIIIIAVDLCILLLILAAIVVGIIMWRRRTHRGGLATEGEADRGIGIWRRAYFYSACFVSLLVAGNGLVQVGSYTLNELFGPEVIARDMGPLAIGLVLSVIWTPIWAWHWRRLGEYVREAPEERSFLLRKIYIYLLLGVAGALAMFGGTETLRWVFDGRSFSGYAISSLIVWTGVWLCHWRLESTEGQPTPAGLEVRRAYIYLGSVVGLSMLAVSMGVATALLLRELYEKITDLPILLRHEQHVWDDAMKAALSVAVTGAVVWGWHWLRVARGDQRSVLRQFYLYTLAILGGATTTLIAAGVIINGVLVWVFGVPDQETAAGHFRFLPDASAALLIGILLWGYHRAVVYVERAAAGELALARRTYGYIMTAIGIGTLSAAIIIFVPTIVGLIIDEAVELLAGDDWWRNQTAGAGTLVILGAPVWAYHWGSREREASRDLEERDSFPRKCVLYGAILAGGLGTLGALSHLLYLVLDAILENDLSLTLLRSGKWSMGILVASLCFGPYYWLVLREDRKALSRRTAVQLPIARKLVTVLVPDQSDDLVDRLESVLKQRVRVLHVVDSQRLAPDLSSEALEQLCDSIRSAPGDQVLVILQPEREPEVLSYR